MAEEQNQQGDAEVQDILDDLDSILSELGPGQGGQSSLEEALPETTVVEQAPAPEPEIKIELTPRPEPPPPAPAPAEVKAPAAKIELTPLGETPPPAVELPPAAAPPSPEMKAEPAPVDETPPPAEKTPAVKAPEKKAEPAPVDETPPAPDGLSPESKDGLKIELAPKAGLLKDSPKKAPTSPPKKEAPKRKASEHRPPMEISLPGGKSIEMTLPKIPSSSRIDVPPPAAEGPIIDDDSIPPDNIPPKAPKEQIRRIGVLYTAKNKKNRDIFVDFLAESALDFSKRPLYMRKVYVEQIDKDVDCREVIDKVRSLHIVAVMAHIEGLPEEVCEDLADVFAKAAIMFRPISAEEIQKKSLVVDIIVDMILLSAEE